MRRLLPPYVYQLLQQVWAANARRRAARELSGARQLNLGSGAKLLPGWANLDRTGPPGVIRLDLTGPLPLASGTIDLIYSEHFIEHVSRVQAEHVLTECLRVLKPSGRIRISTPDLEAISRQYLTGSTGDWSDVNWQPATPCQMMNELHRAWGHTFVFDFAELRATLQGAGFEQVRRCSWRVSDKPHLCGLETRPFHGDLIVEATRPAP